MVAAGQTVTLITVETDTLGWDSPLALSMSLRLPPLSHSLSLLLFSRASPVALLFYFWSEALFNFCREIFPPRNDYCSQEIARRWRRKTGFVSRPFCLRTRRDAAHRERVTRRGRESDEREANERRLRRKVTVPRQP